MGPANHPRRGIHDGRVGSRSPSPRTSWRPWRSIQSQQELLWWEQPLSLGSGCQHMGRPPPTAVGRKSAIEYCAAREWTTPPRKTSAVPISRSSTRACLGWRAPISTRARKEISCVQGRSAPPPAAPGRRRLCLRDHPGRAAFSVARGFCPFRRESLRCIRYRPRPNPLPRTAGQR